MRQELRNQDHFVGTAEASGADRGYEWEPSGHSCIDTFLWARDEVVPLYG